MISNIYAGGLPPAEAGALIVEKAAEILAHKAAGNRLEAMLRKAGVNGFGPLSCTRERVRAEWDWRPFSTRPSPPAPLPSPGEGGNANHPHRAAALFSRATCSCSQSPYSSLRTTKPRKSPPARSPIWRFPAGRAEAGRR